MAAEYLIKQCGLLPGYHADSRVHYHSGGEVAHDIILLDTAVLEHEAMVLDWC